MYQIALIERYLPNSIFWINLIKNKRIDELSVQELLYQYQGFEGELISHVLMTCNESNSALEKNILDLLEINKFNKYVMLYISKNDFQKKSSILQVQTIQVGFEVGVFEEDKTIYSSIFNEILFGHLCELIAFKDSLNKNFLFPDRISAEKYVNIHNQLSMQGKGVEDYEEMTIYEIRKQKLLDKN